MEQVVLLLIGVLAVGSALGVVLMPNAVYSAMMLLLNLLSLATLFLLLHAQFMFAAQLIIYAGAILVLFLFVVTLLNPEGEYIFRDKRRMQRAATISFGLFLGALLIGAYLAAFNKTQPVFVPTDGTNGSFGSVEAFGIALFTRFLLPFELTSLVLLVALIGAVVLGKRK
jgi:NADH:ubiquinone oxidoreductase subunit 6 (subunit J)